VTYACDLAIVGSGFGGSILAMVARRRGLRVVLLERGRHPRFAIGESSSPLAGILIEQLAARYDLPRLRPLAAYGEWQRAYPNLTCGLKRGFTFFKQMPGRPYRTSTDRSNQLLVAASPNDELSDTHWLRADVDAFLVREATALGVEYVDEAVLDGLEWDAAGCPRLVGTRFGGAVAVHARAVVDASGPGGFLARALGLTNHGFDGYPGTQALYSHFTGVARCDAMPDYRPDGEAPPYPVDDAALHHVFDGGWMWVLRFGNGVTSAGIAVTDALAADLRLADGEPAWHRLLRRFPSVAAQFGDARAVRPFSYVPRLAYRCREVAGPGWAMLPSAAAFVDPLFSTGFPLTLLGVERLGRAIELGWASGAGDVSLAAYAAATSAEADDTAAFVAGCYAAFPQFDRFATYAMFYFAAASFSEVARRLDAPACPGRFFGGDIPHFAAALRRLSPCRAFEDARPDYPREVTDAVEPLNVAGLCDVTKRNWYGVDLEDTVRGAAKLGLRPDDVRTILRPKPRSPEPAADSRRSAASIDESG
jgi:tetracycline 7-halogenase / FADH2 O2-dependent halogenase